MRAKARQHKPGVMNKGEAAYAQHLEERKRVGEIVEYLFEPEKLRLADLAFYSPDFFVMLPDGGVEFHEVKGRTTKKRSDGTRVDAPWSREDAKLKIRFAAERFWWYRFAIVFPLKAGGWGRVEFGSRPLALSEATCARQEAHRGA